MLKTVHNATQGKDTHWLMPTALTCYWNIPKGIPRGGAPLPASPQPAIAGGQLSWEATSIAHPAKKEPQMSLRSGLVSCGPVW